MRRLSRTLMLLILVASLICSVGLVANAAGFESAEDAVGYLDSYAKRSTRVKVKVKKRSRSEDQNK